MSGCDWVRARACVCVRARCARMRILCAVYVCMYVMYVHAYYVRIACVRM